MPASQEFNSICYINRYPDIKNGYAFLGSGAPNTWVYSRDQVKGFLMSQKKLSDGNNPFWHWQTMGMSEGRVCGCDLPNTIYSSEFNAGAYLSRYPDVRISSQWKNNPLGHYQNYGIYEGRHPGFEILNSASPAGMVSPGTTTQAQDSNTGLTPGDGTSGLNPQDNLGTGDTTPVVTTTPTDNTGNVGTWIAANSTLVAVIVAGVLIIAHNNKKTKRA